MDGIFMGGIMIAIAIGYMMESATVGFLGVGITFVICGLMEADW